VAYDRLLKQASLARLSASLPPIESEVASPTWPAWVSRLDLAAGIAVGLDRHRRSGGRVRLL
jgi:hypothetical protein